MLRCSVFEALARFFVLVILWNAVVTFELRLALSWGMFFVCTLKSAERNTNTGLAQAMNVRLHKPVPR